MTERPTDPALLQLLLDRLISKESLEVEFKRGRGGLPKDLWPTVSAFANTNGGWILVGVREEADANVLDDLPNPEVRLQDFYNQIRNAQKISYPICGADDATIERLDGKSVLVIRVPAASRRHRPIYVGSSPYGGTYLRRNTGDYPCTKAEVDRMMRDASEVSADSSLIEGYGLDDLDRDALARYRRRYQTENPGSPWNGYDDRRFLLALGGYARERGTDREGVTVAGLLLFGTMEALREWRGRHLIDFRWLPEDGSEQERWRDREPWSSHLFGAFEAIYPRLVRDLPKPFRMRNGVRPGKSPAQEAVSEAFVNLLVHADYAESDSSLILRDDQGFRFRNPGGSRIPKHDLLSGDHSDPRNPILVTAFRYIGLADEAGTGIPKILSAWRELGLKPPHIDVGTERYEFSIHLRNIHFLSAEDRLWIARLGTLEDEPQQLALVHAREFEQVTNAHLCKLTGQHSADATKTLSGLREAGWLVPGGTTGRGRFYRLSEPAVQMLEAVRDGEQVRHPNLFDPPGADSSHKGDDSTHNEADSSHKGDDSTHSGTSTGHNDSDSSTEGAPPHSPATLRIGIACLASLPP